VVTTAPVTVTTGGLITVHGRVVEMDRSSLAQYGTGATWNESEVVVSATDVVRNRLTSPVPS
jgi:hypothetical protein